MYENFTKREVGEEIRKVIIDMAEIYNRVGHIWNGEDLSKIAINRTKLNILIELEKKLILKSMND